MPINFPDLMQHNNVSNYPLVDSDSVRGATRTAVAAVTDLYTIPTNLLKQNATRVWVTAASKFYTLTDIANAGNSAGWTADTTGSVTSVTATSPVASSGGTTPVISLSSGYGDTLNPYASKTANYVLAAPNGTAGTPSFRAIVAADIPTLNQNTTGTAANVTGTVAVANGGSGATTLSGYLKGNGTSAFTASASIPGSDVSGNITGNAANVTGTVAIANGGTGATTAANAINALLPSQATNSGKFLTTDGTAASWATVSGTGTVTSVTLATSLSGLSVTGTNPITTSGTFTIGGTLGASSGGTGQSSYLTGNILYASTSNALAKLAPNNTTTKTMLTQTGNGGSSNPPQWDSFDAILPTQTGNSGKVLGTNGTNASWVTSGAGDVSGPSSSTNNGIAVFSGTTGKTIASNSTITISGTNVISNVTEITSSNGYFGSSGSGVLIGYNGVTASNGSSFMLAGSTTGVVSIAPSGANAGTYTWRLPSSIPASTNYFLKTTDTTGGTGWASIPAAEYLYRLTADESNYTTASLTVVTGFAHTLAASTNNRVDGVLIVNQASATPNFRMAFDAPGTTATLGVFATNFNENAGAQRLTIVNADNTGFVLQQPSGLNYVIVSGFIVTGTTSGNVNFYGGQGTGSSGNPTTLKSGSFLTYTEVL